MNKKTQTIVGVLAVAAIGYLVWKQMSKPKTSGFANLTSMPLCPCKVVLRSDANYDYCADGKVCPRKATRLGAAY